MKQQSKRPPAAAGPDRPTAAHPCRLCGRPTKAADDICDRHPRHKPAAEAELQQTAQQDTAAAFDRLPRCWYCDSSQLTADGRCIPCSTDDGSGAL